MVRNLVEDPVGTNAFLTGIRKHLAWRRSFLAAAVLLTASAGKALAHGGEGLTDTTAWSAWRLTPDMVILTLLLALIYAAGMMRRTNAVQRVSPWRHVAFYGGLAVVFLALQSPIDPIAERLFSMHQIQHLLLRMVGPMLIALSAPQGILIAGLPRPMRRGILAPLVSNRPLRVFFRVITRPAAALAIFIAALYFWQIPRYHNIALLDPLVHYAMHVTMLAAGLLFWWLMFDRRPPPSGLRYGVRLIMLLLTILSNILIGASTTLKSVVLYDAYDVQGRLFGSTPLADELIGGYVMWVPNSMMSIIAILIVLNMLARHEVRLDVQRTAWSSSNSAALLYPTTAAGLVAQARPKNRAAAIGFAILAFAIFSTIMSVGVVNNFTG